MLSDYDCPNWTDILIKSLEKSVGVWATRVDENLFFKMIKDFLPSDWEIMKISFKEQGAYFGYCYSSTDLKAEPFLVVFEEEGLSIFDELSKNTFCICRWHEMPERYESFKEGIEDFLTRCIVLPEGTRPPVCGVTMQQ